MVRFGSLKQGWKRLLATIFLAIGCSTALPASAACLNVIHSGARYTACSFDPASARISFHLRDKTGKPYGAFLPLFREQLSRWQVPIFAMNGGMYEPDLSPAGLYVENGQVIKPANTHDGWGNFHLKPNGVFWLNAGGATVEETGSFLRHKRQAGYATQSGPMLVIDGKLHPAFLPASDSLKIRNGVGVDSKGRVHFVISDDPVRFYDMAILFRDKLDCPNALFLDGSISSLYAPEINRFDQFNEMGPIISVSVDFRSLISR